MNYRKIALMLIVVTVSITAISIPYTEYVYLPMMKEVCPTNPRFHGCSYVPWYKKLL